MPSLCQGKDPSGTQRPSHQKMIDQQISQTEMKTMELFDTIIKQFDEHRLRILASKMIERLKAIQPPSLQSDSIGKIKASPIHNRSSGAASIPRLFHSDVLEDLYLDDPYITKDHSTSPIHTAP